MVTPLPIGYVLSSVFQKDNKETVWTKEEPVKFSDDVDVKRLWVFILN